MNRGTALKWIERLESGEYKHGKCGLRDHDDHFCALGVLLDFLDKEAWVQSDLHGYTWAGSPLVMSKDAMKRCKIKSEEEVLKLAELSDSSNDFNAVIEWLKENYESL
jgi:hypothetical protein